MCHGFICIEAIILCPELSFSFPYTDVELDKAANAFGLISGNDAINGCVGCVDGLLVKIQTPPKKSSGKIKTFYSGHYLHMCINVQAACDAICRFISVCVASPGGTNDIAVFHKCPLHEIIKKLPVGKFIIGDNAYICSEDLLTL